MNINKVKALSRLNELSVDIDFDRKIENLLTEVVPFNEYSKRYNLSIQSYLIFKIYLVYFLRNDLQETKQLLHLFGKTVVIDTAIFDENESIDLWVRDCVYLLLSDDLKLISDFSLLKDSEYEKRVLKGSLVPCIQAVLRDDWKFLTQQIAVCYKNLVNTSRGKGIIPDLEALQGIMDRDKIKVEKAIHTLATKDHKKRNDESIFNELLSIPALGYAKLAWLKGLEVEVDSPLIPQNLLPIRPNERYWDYDYMKEDAFKC